MIHSTNGRKNSAFEAEEAYLFAANDVSAHFLIGKDGRITQFLPLQTHAAWHAGNVSDQIYSNENSIGIECHYTPGEDKNLPRMYAALTQLVQYLRENYTIIGIQTHRSVAVPKGRKADPSFWTDQDFMTWLQSLDRVEPTARYPIIGGATMPPDALYAILRHHSIESGVIDSLVSVYSVMGELTGIGNVWPFAQAVHETGWFTSRRFASNKNPAGLGATDDGAEGAVFSSIAEGVYAQYAHLLCYAKVPQELNTMQQHIALASPRRIALEKAYGLGVAKNDWIGLNRKWNTPSATEKEYTDALQSIITLMQK